MSYRLYYITFALLSSITLLEASLVWDIIVNHIQGPIKAKAVAERSHRQLANVVASQLQGALAPDPGLGIVREGRKAVQFLKNTQENLGALNALEAAEVLVVLVKTVRFA